MLHRASSLLFTLLVAAAAQVHAAEPVYPDVSRAHAYIAAAL